MINQATTYQLYFNLADPLPVGSKVRILFPPEVVLSASFQFTADSGIDQGATLTLSQRNNATGFSKQSLDITGGITAYVVENDGFLFEISGITNPNSTQTSSSFEFFTFDSSMYPVDELVTGLTVQATYGPLKSVKVAPIDQLGVL